MDYDPDRLRYVRISPPPLKNVPKPKTILFDGHATGDVNGSQPRDDKPRNCDRSQSGSAPVANRRDMFPPTKTMLRERVKHLNAHKLDVAVQVKPRFYQKWARNTRKKPYMSDTYNFAAMSSIPKQTSKTTKKAKQRKTSSIKFNVTRNPKMSRFHSTGSLCSNTNSCSNIVEWPGVPTIEVSGGFTDDENEAIEEPVVTDAEFTEETDDDTGGVQQKTKDTRLSVGYLPEIEADTDTVLGNANSVRDRLSDTTSDAGELKHKSDTGKYSHCPEFLSVEVGKYQTESYPHPKIEPVAGYTRVKVVKEAADVSQNNTTKGKPDARRGSVHELTLSKQLISAAVLDGVVSRIPHPENRLESPFRYETESFPTQNKPTHYNYYPSRPIYNDVKKRRERLPNQPGFDFRRCKTDSGLCVTSFPESRIPMKIATSSPRFSIPDNLIVDFETLRIAAHMDKLKRTLSQLGPRDFLVNKAVPESPKAVPTVSSIKPKGVKTVLFGSSAM